MRADGAGGRKRNRAVGHFPARGRPAGLPAPICMAPRPGSGNAAAAKPSAPLGSGHGAGTIVMARHDLRPPGPPGPACPGATDMVSAPRPHRKGRTPRRPAARIQAPGRDARANAVVFWHHPCPGPASRAPCRLNELRQGCVVSACGAGFATVWSVPACGLRPSEGAGCFAGGGRDVISGATRRGRRMGVGVMALGLVLG